MYCDLLIHSQISSIKQENINTFFRLNKCLKSKKTVRDILLERKFFCLVSILRSWDVSLWRL